MPNRKEVSPVAIAATLPLKAGIPGPKDNDGGACWKHHDDIRAAA